MRKRFKKKSMLLHRFPQMLLLLLALSNAMPAHAARTGQQVERAFRHFDLQALNGDVPPCPSANCRFTWAATALALGDAGEYARRLNFPGSKIYAATHGIAHNPNALARFRDMPRSSPLSFTAPGSLALTSRHDRSTIAAGQQRDAPPMIAISINGVATTAMLDTGAAFAIPSTEKERLRLREWDVDLSTTAASGLSAPSRLALADEVQVGPFVMHNLAARVTPAMTISGRLLPSPVYIGYDFLLRFGVVTIDFPAGRVYFNEVPGGPWQCAPMWLVQDSNKVVAGIATDIVIDGKTLRGRIDTGANDTLLIHGRHPVGGDFSPVPNRWLLDQAGQAIALESKTVRGTLAGIPFEKEAARIAIPHPDFDVTIGAAFLEEHTVQLNFAAHRFCMARRTSSSRQGADS